jgi:signal peptidase I
MNDSGRESMRDSDRATGRSGGTDPGTADTTMNQTVGADGDLPAGARDEVPGGARDGSPGGESESASGDAAGGPAATASSGTGQTKTRHARRKRRKRSFWREFPILLAVALVLAVIIKTYAIQAFFIPSGSMENTLNINDRVLINKLVYHFRGIHRGDIVVFNGDGSWDPGQVPTSSNVFSEFVSGFASMFGFGHPSDIYVKRVIGLPGDRVACCDAQGRVTVNGVPLNEGSYLYPGDSPSLQRFNIIVPAGRLWVMGDHRSVSDDSRGHLGDPGSGTIPITAVLGRAFIIIWPPSRWRFLPIPATFNQPALSKQASAAAEGPAGDSAAADSVLGARLEPAGPALPLGLGLAGAVPLTLIQRRIRLRIVGRRDQSRP